MINKLIAAALFVVVSLGIASVTQLDTVSASNNGTLKIHEEGTVAGTESNDPKVCSFNIEAFGLDAGQTGTVSFSVQGGDGPTGIAAGPFDFGPAEADGTFVTAYYNLEEGHYKATLFGKDVGDGESVATEKAKSKVFKVDCEPDVEPVLPTSAVSLVCVLNKYTLTVSNTGTVALPLKINGVDSPIAASAAAVTTSFNAGDVLTVLVDGQPASVQGKLLNNLTLETCVGGMGGGGGGSVSTTGTSAPVVRVSSGFGAGAATDVTSLPVTSGSSAQLASVALLVSSILGAAGAYAARSRASFSL